MAATRAELQVKAWKVTSEGWIWWRCEGLPSYCAAGGLEGTLILCFAPGHPLYLKLTFEAGATVEGERRRAHLGPKCQLTEVLTAGFHYSVIHISYD